MSTLDRRAETSGRAADPGLAAIAQMVHDIDWRDGQALEAMEQGV